METYTGKFAERELMILEASVEDALIIPFKDEILALAEKFGSSGQSGGSAPFVAAAISQAIKKLLLQRPIYDISGLDSEWVDVSQMGDGTILFQNSRCGNLFKNKDGKAWYLDAITWKDQEGDTFSGRANLKDGTSMWSHQFVKAFPFKPKTFYIDVIRKEVPKEGYESFIKNEKQLEKVFKYYDLYN